MKLSKAQLATLEAVERGEVRKVYSCYYSRPDRIDGARKRTLQILLENGLVFLDYTQRRIGQFIPFDYYRLTDSGRDALVAASKIRSEAHSPVDAEASSE